VAGIGGHDPEWTVSFARNAPWRICAGPQRIAEGFPLSIRLLREMHGILLTDGRGAQKQPAEFRRSQNWIGGTRPGNAAFVPPPATHLDAGSG
jgi:Fic family protein